MRIISVVGARPQFIKLAPIVRAMPADFEHIIIHSGQHYDDKLSKALFEELKIPSPAMNLGVGSGSHGVQTGKLLSALEDSYLKYKPDVVLVYGDTNTTLAGALAAVKLNINTVHLEAGLRSFNRTMPEEVNRIATDHISGLLLAPSTEAVRNLRNEGLEDRTKLVGDVMVDAIRYAEILIAAKGTKSLNNNFLVATIHRAENTDIKERLSYLANVIAGSPLPVKLVAHPRLVKMLRDFKIDFASSQIELLEPLTYLEMVHLMIESSGVITDSGGLQKEAYLLGKPCLTLRNETEWVETLANGWNKLDNLGNLIGTEWWNPPSSKVDRDIYGDGKAAIRTLEAIQSFEK